MTLVAGAHRHWTLDIDSEALLVYPLSYPPTLNTIFEGERSSLSSRSGDRGGESGSTAFRIQKNVSKVMPEISKA